MRDATTADVGGTTYAPPARQALLTEALGRLLAGQPLPADVAPAASALARPATVREGIERIMLGHCPRTA